MQYSRRQTIVGGTMLALGTFAGCLGDDDEDDHDDHHDDHDHDDHGHGHFDELGIYEFQLLDRAHDPHAEISYMHGDHWHGAGDFPTVPAGDNLSIGAAAYDENGDEIELWDDYEFQAAVASGADEDIVSFDFHGDHLHIIGEEEGLTEIVFQVWHDDHADYQSEPLAVTVGEDEEAEEDFNASAISEVELLDRAPDPHEQVARWHDDHWDGELPTVPIDDNISIGGRFEDENGNEADLGATYEFRVRLAENAEEIVEFDYHGDHVHIIGLEAGETEVVFQLWHDDHADFETDPITVIVDGE